MFRNYIVVVLVNHGGCGDGDKGILFIAAAFPMDHEDADHIALWIDEAVSTIAASVAVSAGGKQGYWRRA